MRRTLLFAAIALGAAAFAPGAAAQTAPALDAPITLDATDSGQPIRAPAGDLHVTIGQRVLPPGERLPAHKHPYPRLVNVMAGRLRVTNLVTGQVHELKAGDWNVDPVDQWHEAVVVGDEPVRLLTIDQAPPGARLTIPKLP